MVNVQIYRAAELLDMGWSRRLVEAAHAEGRLIRLRPGWYAMPGADPAACRAVATYGALTCISALELHGIWTPPNPYTHVRLARWADRAVDRQVRVCAPRKDPGRVRRPVDDVLTSLACAVRCQPLEYAVAAIDSALIQQRVTRAEVERLVAGEPLKAQRVLRRFSQRAESGTETLARLRLQARGIRVRANVYIPGVGRVDLLVGERLVIECDSRAHHTDAAAYWHDRERDLELQRRGYLVVRLTYEHVMGFWHTVEPSILQIVAERRHMWPRTSGKSGPR